MSIKIKKIIVDVLDSSQESAITSYTPLVVDAYIEEYLIKTIEKTFYSDDAKNCSFCADSKLWEQCHKLSWDLISISHSIAHNIFTIMHRNKEIPCADILFGEAEIDNTNYFYMLKFDHKSAYTHFVEVSNEKIAVNIIQNKALLPSQPTKLSEGFFISVDSPCVKVIERKYMVDGIKDFYISTQILACTEAKSPRQKTTQLLKVAEKVAKLYYSEKDDMDTHISSAMYEEIQKEKPILIKSIGQKFFEKNPIAQKEFFDRLSIENISKDEELSITERLQKKFQKQAIKTESGVEIKIPTQLYSNADEIEFINNPNGTVSLLIKNIKL